MPCQCGNRWRHAKDIGGDQNFLRCGAASCSRGVVTWKHKWNSFKNYGLKGRAAYLVLIWLASLGWPVHRLAAGDCLRARASKTAELRWAFVLNRTILPFISLKSTTIMISVPTTALRCCVRPECYTKLQNNRAYA